MTDNLQKLSDRDYIGPGVWFMLHLLALHGETNQTLKQAYPEIIDLLREKFPCEECREHFIKMTDTLNIRESTQEKYSQFKWSYIAHKMVNERLGKETPAFENAFRFFSDPKSNCKDCALTKKKRGFST